MKKNILLILCSLFFSIVKANNLQIGTPTLPSSTTIEFTVQWDNAWKVASGPSNHDAVWIFVKYQNCTDNIWRHVDLSTTAIDHTIGGSQLTVETVNDAKGVFLKLNTTSITNIASATIRLKFASLVDAAYNYKVFGIEMVNIPAGNFVIGDGASNYTFSGITITEGMQSAGLGASSVYVINNWGSTSPLPATFPLGWNSFYCMKYEISQEQFAAYLNTLTYNLQLNKTANSPASAVGTLAIAGTTNCRNGIRIQTVGVSNNVPAVYGCDLNNNGTFDETDDGQSIACNWLSWKDLTAYLDWSALRPMTEFEFEKVCRGSTVALANEYAWGSTVLLQAHSNALTNSRQSSEVSTASGVGLCAYGANNTNFGPLRCGFAPRAATSRVEAGASFYGVMDMSGNVSEQCVGGYNFNYSTFTNTCGDGELSLLGEANIMGWPATGGGNGGGAVIRGGDWYNGWDHLRVSTRQNMTTNFNNSRSSVCGGRGVR